MRLTLPVTVGAAVVLAALACGGKPAPAPAPVVIDSTRIKDSLQMEAQRAREQAVRDSIARANAERERIQRQHEADSLGALQRTTAEVAGMLTTMIHFDYDKASLRPEDAQMLDRKIAILQANPGVTLTVTGHADERGSDEYNLALGNRRALVAKKYLTDHGIAGARVMTMSRGEEQPLNPGHDEAAWAQNRRDEFAITAGGDRLMKPSGM